MKRTWLSCLSIFASLVLAAPLLRGASSTQDSTGAIQALQQWLSKPVTSRPDLDAQAFAQAALDKASAKQAHQLLWDDHAAFIRMDRQQEWKDEAIVAGGQTLRLKERHFGQKPPGGWNLYISMHGGGNAPAAINDEQWENQIKLYQPKDSLYIAPRAPTNDWNLWHEPNIDVLFNRLLEDAFVLGDVDPNHVYIMGYSAGGDGVYQLAPRMADRWAAAAMMAGHPNDASPLGLRNIGFTIHVGALDNGYDRNKVAQKWGHMLDELQKEDPKGYAHEVQLHKGRGHWMNLEDRVAVDWMAKFTRNPIPLKVVWKQSPVTHDSFYWLGMPAGDAAAGQLVIATRSGQHIEIDKVEGVKALTILLNDAMLDLDQPITISANGRELFKGVAPRRIQTLHKTLSQKGDPDLMFDAAVTVKLDGGPK